MLLHICITEAVHVCSSYEHRQLPAYHEHMAHMQGIHDALKCKLNEMQCRLHVVMSRLHEKERASGVLMLLPMLQTNRIHFSVTGLGNLSGSLTIIAKFEPVSTKRFQITYESAALVCIALSRHKQSDEQLLHVCCLLSLAAHTQFLCHCNTGHANGVYATYVVTL